MYNHIELNKENQLVLFKELLTLKSDIILTDHSGNINVNINDQDLNQDSKLFHVIFSIYKQTPFDKNKSYNEIVNTIENIFFRTNVISVLSENQKNKKTKPINNVTIILRLLTHNPVIQKNIIQIEEEFINIILEQNILGKRIKQTTEKNKKRL